VSSAQLSRPERRPTRFSTSGPENIASHWNFSFVWLFHLYEILYEVFIYMSFANGFCVWVLRMSFAYEFWLAIQFTCTRCRLRTFYLAIEEPSNWTVLSMTDYNCLSPEAYYVVSYHQTIVSQSIDLRPKSLISFATINQFENISSEYIAEYVRVRTCDLIHRSKVDLSLHRLDWK
jgi:hypothetical protein